MLFTEGKEEREYERMMQQKPCFDKRKQQMEKQRDCPHCLYFNEKKKCCGLEECTVFKE